MPQGAQQAQIIHGARPVNCLDTCGFGLDDMEKVGSGVLTSMLGPA